MALMSNPLTTCVSLQWRNNEPNGVSNDRRLDFYAAVCLDADKRIHQSSAPLALVREIHRWPECKKNVTPARSQWSYVLLVLTHRSDRKWRYVLMLPQIKQYRMTGVRNWQCMHKNYKAKHKNGVHILRDTLHLQWIHLQMNSVCRATGAVQHNLVCTTFEYLITTPPGELQCRISTRTSSEHKKSHESLPITSVMIVLPFRNLAQRTTIILSCTAQYCIMTGQLKCYRRMSFHQIWVQYEFWTDLSQCNFPHFFRSFHILNIESDWSQKSTHWLHSKTTHRY